MHGDHGSQSQDAEQRQRDQDRDQGQGQADVLQHDGPGTTRMVQSLGEVAQVFAHQGHVGGFDGHVGAHGAHGDAEVGGGQGGCVVDAVADHGRR
ncbi:Uncharacterised protein [Mycobacteroides abscessus subsp. abscessus]|nr:Uncharacterised protein [Mycobacteroides abscessus subsp. abscessus]